MILILSYSDFQRKPEKNSFRDLTTGIAFLSDNLIGFEIAVRTKTGVRIDPPFVLTRYVIEFFNMSSSVLSSHSLASPSTTELPHEHKLCVAKHISYIKSLDIVRRTSNSQHSTVIAPRLTQASLAQR